MMGFDGTSVTDQVKTLIEKYHVGSILLKAQNLKCRSPVISVVATALAFANLFLNFGLTFIT